MYVSLVAMWLWARRAMLVMGYSALLITSMPQGAQSAQSFQCLGGTDSAIVNACGARWEAANIRAHIAVGKYGGAPPACLDKTAQLLDQEAAKWLASNSYVKFTRWPCGAKPAVASADDGVLSKACPNAAGRTITEAPSGASRANPHRLTLKPFQVQVCPVIRQLPKLLNPKPSRVPVRRVIRRMRVNMFLSCLRHPRIRLRPARNRTARLPS